MWQQKKQNSTDVTKLLLCAYAKLQVTSVGASEADTDRPIEVDPDNHDSEVTHLERDIL